MVEKGARVWIPHSSKVWSSGVVLRLDKASNCIIVACDGEESCISLEDPPFICNPEILLGANDLTTLSYLHEPAVLHSLQLRYEQSAMIYTYCGIVLVAINPYQPLSIYGDWIRLAYSTSDPRDMDPHVFAVAQEAYHKLKQGDGNQSIIVSGESGAGKTVNAKYILQYFASVSGENNNANIESKVLASNNILEAVGNAKTTRNDNSSRFGKYIEIGFDGKFRVQRAQLRTYLLEKTRVVTQATGERNYHIFYQLLAKRDEPQFQQLNLGSPNHFHYTSQGGSPLIEGVDDSSMFDVFASGLGQLGFQDQQKSQIFSLLAAILHLGNVGIEQKDEDSSYVSEYQDSLKQCSSLLSVPSSSLSQWLCNRQIITTHEVLVKPLTVSQAISSRDSLSSHLYDHLFEWIVERINQSLTGSHTHSESFIGVLDIYGFEIFRHNSFEQFCINYANEKLQQQFNIHVFKLEQQEYMSEGITWSFIDYYDNQPCIDLIEGKLGILDLLNETCKMPNSSDSMLIDKLYEQILKKGHSHFTKPRTSRTSFGVRHYASTVLYETQGFISKNTDLLSREHLKLLQSSQNGFVSGLFPIATKEGRKVDVGSMFKDSLSTLMGTLNLTTPHYIRCIKPNDTKTPFSFNRLRVVEQLRACGIIETIRISAMGFPSRYFYKEFIDRYWMLLPKLQLKFINKGNLERDQVKLCQVILKQHINDIDKYRVGTNKVFFRAGQVAYLESLRSALLHESCLLIQRNVRMWRERRRYLKVCKMVRGLQSRIRGLIVRRRAQAIRESRAATKIQSMYKMYKSRRAYHSLRKISLFMQSVYRGMKARRLALALKQNKAAVVLQAYWRRRQGHKRALWRKRSIIRVQCCVRQWIATRRLKELKIEARSVYHLQNLNKGLELKIIELQQRLTLEEDKNARLAAKNSDLNKKCKELEELSVYESQCTALKNELNDMTEELRNEKIQREALEMELAQVKEELVQNEELRQLEVTLFNEKLDELDKQVQEIDENDVIIVTPSTRRLSSSSSAQQRSSVERKVSVQETLSESIKRVKTFASERLQETNVPEHDDSINNNPVFDDASLYYSLPSEMREWNESLVTKNQSFYSQQSISNNALLKFLQEEVSRLTEENTNLKEELGLHYLTEDVTLVALSPHTKKKGGVPNKTIRRLVRPKPVLGMLSWKESDLPQIMKTIITDPDHFLSEGTCIEGHILFMCLRYADHCSSDTMTTQLIESTVTSLQYLTKHYKDNLNLLCHWLGNITCLLQSMRQYSGDPVYYNPCKDITGLTSFELSDYHDFITAEATSIYYLIINHLERTLEPLIVPGLLEHESIPGLTSARPVGWGRTLLGIVKPVIVTVSDIERFLNDLLNQLELCLVDTYLIEQMFKQIFYFINGVMLNYLLFRKDLCHWTSGMQIRYNLNVLEEWLREHKLTCVVDTLQPIVQASKLLQMKKETQDDARCISEFCANLNTQQIQKILRMYTPSIESESRVPLSVIQFVGQCHCQDHRFGSETENLMIDSRYQFPVSIPYSPTLFNFAAIDVPKQLDFLIKI